MRVDSSVADEGFARIFIFEGENSLKLDFVNDVQFRSGTTIETELFLRTDNLLNILSNKVTALGRYLTKDVVDIVFICGVIPFKWEQIFKDANEKDLWANPINAAEVLEQFPIQKTAEIYWIGKVPSDEWSLSCINSIIPDMLEGCENSLYK